MSRGVPVPEWGGLNLQRLVVACLEAAVAEAASGADRPKRAAHRVRREMKRLRAIVQMVPKPRPVWVDELGREASVIHRELAKLRDGCVVAATLEKIRLRHPRRWKAVLPAPCEAKVKSVGCPAIDWVAVGRRLRFLETRVALNGAGWGREGNAGAALRRTYRRARRARAQASERATSDQAAVHAWRKAVRRLCFQLQLAVPLLSGAGRKRAETLAPLARALGRCGDLEMAREWLARRRLSGPAARARNELSDWIERKRRRLARGLLVRTAEFFERSPRAFAKKCLRR